jgi:hypothetical protein
MALGNRLAPRMGGNRRAAFIQAWGLELAVRGVSFGNRQEALRRLAAYSPADGTLQPGGPRRRGGYGRGTERPRTFPPGVCAPEPGPGRGGLGREAPRPAGSVRHVGLGQ